MRKSMIQPFQTGTRAAPGALGGVSKRIAEKQPEFETTSHYAFEELSTTDPLLEVFPAATAVVYAAAQPRDISGFAKGSRMNANNQQ